MATGDANACAAVYDQSATPAFSLIACILGDRAAAEETLRTLYVEISDRARRGEHRDRDPIAWILSLARSAAVRRLRANSKGTVAGLGEHTVPDAHLALNGDQQKILQMIYFGGLTVREAALRLERSVEQVTTELSAAMAVLRRAPLSVDSSRPPLRRTRSGQYRVVTANESSPSPA
jgi:DNA-directed RNA polymerase specialized sigma24 family protein